jgi:AcrR family transcriptional regulator
MTAERRPRDPERTRAEMVEAALRTLREEGFAGTTARAIAARGGFNQALIYYHFGGVNQLLLAVLDRSAAERLERYREALAAAATLQDKIAAAERLFREDVRGGHITVLSELIAGSLAHPELGPELVARLRPWLDFTQEALGAAFADPVLAQAVPLPDLSFALVALYLGLNLLIRLDPSAVPADELFALMRRVAPLVQSLQA